MSQQAMLCVDIGTTGCRAVIYDLQGASLASHALEYPLYTPMPGWAEQQPEEIYQAVFVSVRHTVQQAGLPPSAIAGLCFSAVFHSVIPVDESGEALAPMMSWADSRSQPYAEKIIAGHDVKELYSRTSCPMHPMYLLPKILWLRHETPAVFARAAKFVSIKEYILYRLLDRYVVDKSIASGTGLFNIHTQEWDSQILALAGITEDHLSPVVATTHCEYGLKPDIAASLGLAGHTPVVIGAGDGVLSSLGSGAVHPGQLTAMIGTSGAVRVVSSAPKADPRQRTWCYNLTEDYWVLGGAINNGGIALQWFRDKFAAAEVEAARHLGRDVYDLLGDYAAQVPPGSEGLVLLPYYTGERAPFWNANARGVLFGLNLTHDKRHIIRATLEGVTYRMFSIFTALEEVSGDVREIRASGSFTRSALWLQIMADVFGRTISVPGEPQGSAFGAFILGMSALGLLPGIKAVDRFSTVTASFEPNAAHTAVYHELFAIYQRVYWNLQEEFAAISALQRKLKESGPK